MSAATSAADGPSPRISVLLPLVDERGLRLDSVRSWVVNGPRDPASYELVVMLDDDAAWKADELRCLLRSHDRVIHSHTDNEMELFHLAATHSRGEILLFSEGPRRGSGRDPRHSGWFDAHPESGFFALATGVSRERARGARAAHVRFRIRSVGAPGSLATVSSAGQRLTQGELPGRWRTRVPISPLRRMAPVRQAARSRAAALPLRSVRVHHVNCETFGQFHDSIGEFGRGESLFRLEETEHAFVRRFFGMPPEWSAALFGRRAPIGPMARAVTRRVLSTLHHTGTRDMAPLRQDLAVIGDLLRRWLWGRWLLPFVLRSSLRWWKAVLMIGGPVRGRHWAFLRYYDTEAAIARVEFALQRKSQGTS